MQNQIKKFKGRYFVYRIYINKTQIDGQNSIAMLDFKSEDFLYIIFEYGIPTNIISLTTRFEKVYKWNIEYQCNVPEVIKCKPYSLIEWDNLIKTANSIKIEEVVDGYNRSYESAQQDLQKHFIDVDKTFTKARYDATIEYKDIIKKSLNNNDPIKNLKSHISILSEKYEEYKE